MTKLSTDSSLSFQLKNNYFFQMLKDNARHENKPIPWFEQNLEIHVLEGMIEVNIWQNRCNLYHVR